LQTPVFVLSDLDLGMNNWMSDPFVYPEKPLDRGKVLTKEDLDRLGGFARYRDVDGDAIGWRTLPGTTIPRRRILRAARDTTTRQGIRSGRTSTRK
jgi:2-oxoglutarate ferredoxin oxidoreductase subunit alpha